MILTQSQFIFTDGFCGYLSNLSLITQSLSRNLDLRDASASKNKKGMENQIEKKTES